MKVHIITFVNAPIDLVFNLVRSMYFHAYSVRNAGESIVDGRMHGLIEMDQTVTFKGKHFGFIQIFKAKIIKLEFPNEFTDVMVKGSFKSFIHVHKFFDDNGITKMTDEIIYQCPFGYLGKAFDWVFLNSYLKKILKSRVKDIKECCENNEWKKYL